jgi:hypothetical protein
MFCCVWFEWGECVLGRAFERPTHQLERQNLSQTFALPFALFGEYVC